MCEEMGKLKKGGRTEENKEEKMTVFKHETNKKKEVKKEKKKDGNEHENRDYIKYMTRKLGIMKAEEAIQR